MTGEKNKQRGTIQPSPEGGGVLVVVAAKGRGRAHGEGSWTQPQRGRRTAGLQDRRTHRTRQSLGPQASEHGTQGLCSQ